MDNNRNDILSQELDKKYFSYVFRAGPGELSEVVVLGAPNGRSEEAAAIIVKRKLSRNQKMRRHLELVKQRAKEKKDKMYNPNGACVRKRGVIQEYSRSSKRRSMEAVLSHMPAWKPKKVGGKEYPGAALITLTYPKHYPPIDECKKHLLAFFQRIRRRYPLACGHWCLEWQRRGAPHFHLLVSLGEEPYVISRMWVSDAWATIVGNGKPDEVHLRVGTKVQSVKKHRDLAAYLSKELSKRFQIHNGYNGRYWGLFNRACLSRYFYRRTIAVYDPSVHHEMGENRRVVEVAQAIWDTWAHWHCIKNPNLVIDAVEKVLNMKDFTPIYLSAMVYGNQAKAIIKRTRLAGR